MHMNSSRVCLQFGCQLEFMTNKSQEGSQFCRGFGGIGGILRYSVDTTLNEVR
jgi:peptide chain release factor subunit 1